MDAKTQLTTLMKAVEKSNEKNGAEKPVIFGNCAACEKPILRDGEKRRIVGGKFYHADCFQKPPESGNGHGGDMEAVAAILSKYVKSDAVIDADAVRALARSEVEAGRADMEALVRQEVGKLTAPLTIEVKRPDGEVKAIRGAHALMPRLLYLIGLRENVYLWGPPGSGKSTAARQVAEALGLDWGYTSLNPQTPESRLIGYMDAGGNYRETVFHKLYKDGGVYCIDEMDNASPALLTTLNSMLENGHGAFPCGIVARHKDFSLVCTGNTNGRGATAQFPDRRPFDAAFAERFLYLAWGYDTAMERAVALSINPDAAKWVDWVQTARTYCEKHHPRLLVTPRASFKIAALLRDKEVTAVEALEMAIFKGTAAETVAQVMGACPAPKW